MTRQGVAYLARRHGMGYRRRGRPRSAVLTTVLLAATLSLPLIWPGGCALDRAQVEAVEPATFTLLATLSCGGVRCFVRAVETEGRRVSESRACEVSEMSRSLRIVPPDAGP